jgi:hypothetical protein
VHILCNDEDIPLSPFMAWIEAPGNFDPNKVKNSIMVEFNKKIIMILG